jgi:hypothetical protein
MISGHTTFFILANISGHRKLRYLNGFIFLGFEREKKWGKPLKISTTSKKLEIERKK